MTIIFTNSKGESKKATISVEVTLVQASPDHVPDFLAKEEGEADTPKQKQKHEILNFASAEIKEVDNIGNLELQFSHDFIEDYRLSNYSLSLTIRPFDKEQEPPTFTWLVKEQSDQTVELKLLFDHPEEVSPNLEEDKLVVTFNITSPVFQDQPQSLFLDPALINVTHRIPKQMRETVSTLALAKSSKTAGAGLQYSVILSFIASILMSGVLFKMLGMINSLQLIIHLPIFSVSFPANSQMVYKALVPVVTFDLLEQIQERLPVLTTWMYPRVEEMQEVP